MATKEAEKYKEKGNTAFKAGDHVKAIEMYTYATELDPKNPIFFTNRSNAYYLMKNFEKSARDASKAIKNDASWAKGHYRLGMALWAMKDLAGAEDAFKKACSMNPKNASFKGALDKLKAEKMKGMSEAEILKGEGNDLFKVGQIEPAEAIYSKAIAACKATEKDTQVKLACLANRAACYRQLYLPEKCIEDCSVALDIDPNHVKCLIRRAQAYESMEKYKKALADFTKVCTVDTNAKMAFEGRTRIQTSMRKLGMM